MTADVDKRLRGQPSRVLFSLSGELTSTVSEVVRLGINNELCRHYVVYIRVSHMFMNAETVQVLISTKTVLMSEMLTYIHRLQRCS